MKKGVYTALCEKCGQPNYMHIDGMGGFDPRRCRLCKTDFVGVEGDRNNEYKAKISENKQSLPEAVKENHGASINMRRKESSKSNVEKKENGSFRLKIHTED